MACTIKSRGFLTLTIMTNSKIKQMPQASRPAPLTDEEIAKKKVEFIMQKREAFSMGFLNNLCQNMRPEDFDNKEQIVVNAVAMADHLIYTLYGLSLTRKEEE